MGERSKVTDADKLIQRYNSGERNFKDASLREATVTDAQLAQARSLEGATLLDGTVHE